MLIAISNNGTDRQELHSTLVSAKKSEARWVALGFSAATLWLDGLDNQQAVVIVKE